MSNRIKTLLVIIFFCSTATIASEQKDSMHILSINEFMDVVQKFHPVAKQASLIPQQAKELFNVAKGGWDPLIYSDFERKVYDGSNYYSYFENSIKIPTWYGIEVKAGYDYVTGNKLNPESKLPQSGLGYLGISIPLGKNLVLDKRMAALRQAQIFREASEQQKIILLNNLLLDATQVYYNWSYAYNELEIYRTALKIAEARFEATKKLSALGDISAIDTVEALTQLQSRQFQLNDARLNFANTKLELENYLWLENEINYPSDSLLIPSPLTSDFVSKPIDLKKVDELEVQLKQTHPDILNYNFKIEQLDIERRIKIENLKPTINANYNLLSERFNFQSSAGNIFANNYKLGLNFSMPLSFAQGRSELKITKLKIADTNYQLDIKTQELVNKMRSYFNQLINFQTQTTLYEQTILNLKKLFEGEETRFKNGESSIFLVNTRENKLIESQLKLRELQSKFFKTEMALKWALGSFSK